MPIDYSKYPDNWKTEIVPRILKRANSRCEIYGIKNKQILYSCKLYLRTENGKYGYRQIWISNESDLIKIKQLMKVLKGYFN